jgi:hypothetical protein
MFPPIGEHRQTSEVRWMTRWAYRMAIWGALAMACADAMAANRENPPRYRRGSYAEYIVRPRNGKPSVRQVYNGYTSHFPPPPFLYYGYPHGKDASGLGFNDALSPGF